MSNESHQIADAGDKLGGAVKDDWASYVRHEKQNAAKASVATLWPRPDWQELIEEIASLPEHTNETAHQLAATLYVVREMAVEHQKRQGAFAGGKGRRVDEGVATLKARYLSELQAHTIRCSFDPGLHGMAMAVFDFAHVLVEPALDEYDTEVNLQEIERKADAIIAQAGVEPRAARSASVGYDNSEAQRAYYAGTIDRKTFMERYGEEQRQARRNARIPALADEVAKLLRTSWPDAMPSKGRRRELAPLPKRVRLGLENLNRTGPEHRHGRNIRPEEIVETFGIRGVEFGNWVSGGERQVSINLAFDAFHDLADVLGIEPRDIGRGRLGIGFGSRGRGISGGMAAAAHYETHRVIINLTRMNGDGSLAHEMGHKFEHGLVGFRLEPGREGRGRGKLAEKNSSYPSRHWNHPERRPTLLADAGVNAAFLDVMDTIMKEDPSHKGAGWRGTRYLAEAQGLSRYWSAPLEMFARAFECYVFDWLKERGRVSQYLVHGVEGDRFERGFRGNPYPMGEERQRINAAMAKLIEAWREAQP